MVECSNFVCLNEVKGGLKYSESFCRSCRKSSLPFVFVCKTCQTTFTGKDRKGRIPLLCSDICKKKRRSLKRKVEYLITHPKKTKTCPLCKKKFNSRNRKYETKYCSYKCSKKRQANRRKIIRVFSGLKPELLLCIKRGD